jgi:predicted dithiol-disulfide oxidoreductase (DUF899 family)
MDPDMDVYPERGCPGCSMYADQLSNLLHLRERDTRVVAVSRGEQKHLQHYRICLVAALLRTMIRPR